MLNMVQGDLHQLKCHPLLFINLNHFYIKAASTHPVIQKEVYELLVSDATEPAIGAGSFY